MTLSFDPYISLTLWILLSAAAAATWTIYVWLCRSRLSPQRRTAALTLMAAAMALPLAILLNPIWVEQLPPPAGKPVLTVLVDRSASMTVGDAGQISRWERATALATAVMNRMGGPFDVRLRTFAETSTAATLSDLNADTVSGEGTDIAAALDESLVDLPQGQALLLISDGSHNMGGGAAQIRQAAQRARAMAVPVFSVPLIDAAEVADVEVQPRLPYEIAFANQEMPVTVNIKQRGYLADRVRVSLIREGDTIDEHDTALRRDSTAALSFRIRHHKNGLYRYQIRADELPGEVTAGNNRATLLVRVLDEPIRVLLLEGQPYWDTKFLLRAFAADPALSLTSVVRLSDQRFLRRVIARSAAGPNEQPVSEGGSSAKPDTKEEQWQIAAAADQLLADAELLKSFQIVVLGRDADRFLSDAALVQLKKWLAERSGSLVCFRGAPASQINQRLAELLPLRWASSRESRFRIRWTESGQTLQWLPESGDDSVLPNLPSLTTMTQLERAKPLAVVLAAQDDRQDPAPAITWHPVGTGRVVVIEGAGMWRWAFLQPQYKQYDEVYGQLWRSLTRWLAANAALMPAQGFQLRSDKVTFAQGETATATLLAAEGEILDVPPVVELTQEGQDTPQFVTSTAGSVAGEFRVVFGKLAKGQYQARVAKASASDLTAVTLFDVREDWRERLDVTARPDLMRLAAEESGGAVLSGTGVDEISQKFHEHLSAINPPRTAHTPAWDRPWVLAAVLSVWAASWTLRRWLGLI